jgi:hypothetical protein
MATIKRRRRGSHAELTAYKRYELLTGEIKYPALGYDGYGDMHDNDLHGFIRDEMRTDWEAHREELIAFWQSGEYTKDLLWLFACGGPGQLPWAAKIFDKQ